MVPETIDLTGDSDMDDGHTPNIDHTTTLRANILRGFFNRSLTRSPAKPGLTPLSPPKSSHGPSTFLDMIRSQRGFPIASQPPKEVEVQREEASKPEDDVVSSKTQESSMADAEVSFFQYSGFLITELFIQDPITLHNLG